MRAARLLPLVLLGVTRVASAETAPAVTVDRVAVRFFAPETGGPTIRASCWSVRSPSRPASRPWPTAPRGSATARRIATSATPSSTTSPSRCWPILAEKLIDDSPADKRPAQKDIDAVLRLVSSAQVERLGGRARVDAAAAAEQLDASEVDAILHRGAFAAWYLDRAVTPLLHPSDEQLRDVYRTAAHPYRGQPFEAIHDALSRWFVIDRVRVAESAFLQAARSHVKIVVTP